MRQEPENLKDLLARIEALIPAPKELTPEQMAEQVRLEEERKWAATSERMGVPKRLRNASFEGGYETSALRITKQYLDGGGLESGGCLVLAGPTGVGKSYAAAALLRAVPLPRRFFDFPCLCGALVDPERRREALDEAKRSQLAVFDDFRVEQMKTGGGLLQILVEEILSHREGQQLSTLITTNLTVEELKERLTDRIVDRLRGEWGRLYAVPGQSLRAQGRVDIAGSTSSRRLQPSQPAPPRGCGGSSPVCCGEVLPKDLDG